MLDVKERTGALLQCLSYEKFCIMVDDDWTKETTCHCLVRNDVFPRSQCQNGVGVTSSVIERTLMNDFDEAVVEFVAEGHWMTVLDLTGPKIAREKEHGCRDLHDSNPHQEGSEANEEDNAK